MNTPRLPSYRLGAHVDELADVADDAVALVEQAVGRLACAFERADLFVQPAQLLRQRIDRRDRRMHVEHHAALQASELFTGMAKARSQFLCAAKRDLAC